MPTDMWEHSLLIMLMPRCKEKKYLQNMLKIVDWEVINNRLDG